MFFISSCSSNQEVEKLQAEIDMVKQEKLNLQLKLEKFENSIIIPYDSLSKYIIPTTFHPEQKTNIEGEFSTLLAWAKFPDDIKVEWSIKKGEGMLKNRTHENLFRSVLVKYDKPGVYDVYGTYKITLPNGTVLNQDWLATNEVKN